MMNKVIRIYCKEEDTNTIKKAMKTYTNKDGFMVSAAIDNVVRILFNCSIFKVKNLKHDLELLSNIGIEAEIR